MIKKSRLSKILVLSFTVASLLTTSFGGAFASSALAADIAATEQKESNNDKEIITGIVALGLLAVLASGGDDDSSSNQTSNSNAKTSTPVSSGNVKAAESKAVQLLNADRAKYGLPALKVNSALTGLAERYAQDMINRGYFAHNNPEGQTPFDRMQAAGISYKYAGENLAINSSVDAAQVAFMNSSGHRENVLSSNFNEVGIGVRTAPNGSLYVVQEFIGK
ncbi:hypothetical protein SDC9_14744 [bioreactor metagenome]|uniref:SCP domain-containing protein n=1 Tax=bioreactor metagenome TaxID=1076179 RepID=A0A644TTJ7_9ZZZZ|nr:CAP domain-containing protein [Negativicutes bacterium]